MQLLTIFPLLLGVPAALALWPIPRSLETGQSTIKLAPKFRITVDTPEAAQHDDVVQAVARSQDFIQHDNLKRLVVGRGASDTASLLSAPSLPSLRLALKEGARALSISDEATKELGTRMEGYVLNVPDDGSPATLLADSTLGLLRGLTTFEQLWYSNNGQKYTVDAPISIEDSPAYPYRGFMLDTSRNYYPVADIKRTLDAMNWVKLNTFHWHIVDSQSFPLEVPEFPELATHGAYSAEEVYTSKDVQDITQYAAARGIDVLVEIDTPGHTAAISASHPEHIACNEATPWTTYANEPPAGQLRLASEETITFTASLLASIARMFPSKLFSTGGDEINHNCYAQDPKTQADLSNNGKTLEQALDNFTQVCHSALRAEGKTPVVWEEMVLRHGVSLSKDTIAMVWISSRSAASVVAKDFRMIHAPSDYFYLDCGAGEWLGNNPKGHSWCDPFKSWQKSYTFDPLANIPADKQHLVLGGQQLLWSEQASPENLDSIVWPRAASAAEIFWTGATLPDGGQRTARVDTALPRLHDLRFRMIQRGVRATALQPTWCALHPGACDLPHDWHSKFERILSSGWIIRQKLVDMLSWDGLQRVFNYLFV